MIKPDGLSDLPRRHPRETELKVARGMKSRGAMRAVVLGGVLDGGCTTLAQRLLACRDRQTDACENQTEKKEKR